MSLREQVLEELNNLEESELKQVADYLAFMRFQSRRNARVHHDETRWADLYAEDAEEDRLLAEAGLDGYNQALLREDASTG
jgi:hypothetical protein